MKKKLPMIIVNFSSNNKVKLENISGDIRELNDVSLSAYRSNGVVLVNNIIISKHGIKKDRMISLDNDIVRIPIDDDKEFYRGKGFCNNNIYEKDDIRFAANINQNEYKKKVKISYRDKKSGELIEFVVDADPNWYFTKAVYSNNDKHKIMFESPKNSQYVIVDVNLKNKALKVDKVLNRDVDINDKTRYITQDSLMNSEAREINNLNKWYFYNEEISKNNNVQEYKDNKLSSRKIVSIDPINYDKMEYSLEVKKSLIKQNYHTYFYDDYIYDVIDENNELTIRKINTKSKQEELYKDISLVNELRRNKDNDVEFYKGFIRDGKLYCIFNKYNKYKYGNNYPNKSIDFYINVIDLNSKESLYLGKVTNTLDIRFDRKGGE